MKIYIFRKSYFLKKYPLFVLSGAETKDSVFLELDV